MKITEDQWLSFIRHIVSGTSTAISVLVMVHIVSAKDAQTVTTGVSDIAEGFQSIVAGVTLIVPIAMGLWAMVSSSMKSRIQAVNKGDNGVKVVASTSPSPQINEPLK